MLRASVEADEGEVDLRAISEGAKDDSVGVEHAAELTAFAEAALGRDEAALASARARLRAKAGSAALVDAAGVVGNFERMARIADATGIPLDAPLDAISASMRAELGIDAFGSAANTPSVSPARRLLGRALAPFARYLMPALAGLSRRFAKGA
jgi:hypothetical protein